MPNEDLLIEQLVSKIDEANVYFLTKIGELIKKIRDLTPTEAKRLVQILKYGGNYEDILSKLSKLTKMSKKDIEQIFSSYAKKDLEFAKKFYDYRNVPFKPFRENSALKRQVKALANITNQTMENFTRSRAIGYTIKGINGKTKFLGLKKAYEKVLDEALLNIGQGKDTFDNSMVRILRQLGESGLKTLDYASGRSIRLDSMVRMHLKNGLRELHNEDQRLLGEEFGADGVELSVHSNPAPDHEEAQGRQFSYEEFEKLQTRGVATTYDGKEINMHLDLRSADATRLAFRPISEYNCYHYTFAIVLGVSQPIYSNEELQKMIDDNNKGFDFEGKHYTMYDGMQLQRTIERKIREQKDVQILARESDNTELILESQNKITKLNRRYKELLEASGLKPNSNRMRVSGYKRVNVKKHKVQLKVEPKEKLNDVIDGRFYQNSKIFKKSKDILDLSNNENINIYNATNKLNKIEINERKNLKKAYYSRLDKKIYTTGVNEGDINPEVTLWHEMGHALDDYNLEVIYQSNNETMRTVMGDYYRANPKVPDSVKEYFKSFREASDKEFEEKNIFEEYFKNFLEIREKAGETDWNMQVYRSHKEKYPDMYERDVKNRYDDEKSNYYWNKKKTNIEYAQMLNLSDMFSAISKGEYNTDFCKKYGYHTKAYFNLKTNNPTTELFANFVSLKMTGSKKNLEFFKKEAPEIYDELEKLYKKIGDDLSVK